MNAGDHQIGQRPQAQASCVQRSKKPEDKLPFAMKETS